MSMDLKIKNKDNSALNAYNNNNNNNSNNSK